MTLSHAYVVIKCGAHVYTVQLPMSSRALYRDSFPLKCESEQVMMEHRRLQQGAGYLSECVRSRDAY